MSHYELEEVVAASALSFAGRRAENDLLQITLGTAGAALCPAYGQFTMTSNPSTSSVRYVGLDVHKRKIVACIMDGAGRVRSTFTVSTDRAAITAFAGKVLKATDHVALEATTNCWAIASLLKPFVESVTVSNPMATRAIAKAKVKTDKVDARVLAHLLRCNYLPPVWHPDEQTQRMRQLTGRRAALVQQRTMLRNRIHSVLHMRLVETPSQLFSPKGIEWLKNLLASGRLDDGAVFMIESDLRLLESIGKEIERFERLLAQEAYALDQVRLLMTLPGVDMLVAMSLLAALGDIRRFRSPKEVASYLGLVPSTRQSADKCYHGPITKCGNVQARWMLIQACQHLGRNPGPLGHFFRRLKKRKNHNMAVVAAARKMAMIAFLMLKNNEPYRYAIPQSTAAKLARLRVRATGQRRKGGPGKGKKPTAKMPGGSRTIKSLDRVYAEEGLPGRKQHLPLGERKMLKRTGCDQFADSLASDRVVPRKNDKTSR